jgi:hypothetical protein
MRVSRMNVRVKEANRVLGRYRNNYKVLEKLIHMKENGNSDSESTFQHVSRFYSGK